MDASINLEKIMARVTGCSQAFVKRNGERTNEPRLDAGSGLPFYWMFFKLFPVGSIGGEDVQVLAKCPAATTPIDLNMGEAPLVELLNPRVEFADRGLTLVVDGVKRIKESK